MNVLWAGSLSRLSTSKLFFTRMPKVDINDTSACCAPYMGDRSQQLLWFSGCLHIRSPARFVIHLMSFDCTALLVMNGPLECGVPIRPK